MLKNISLRADENLIEKARQRARQKNSTLNAEFRMWLKVFTRDESMTENYQRILEQLNYVQAGKRFSREVRNAR